MGAKNAGKGRNIGSTGKEAVEALAGDPLADGELKPFIRDALSGGEFGSAITDGWIRISSIALVCPREEVLAQLYELPQQEAITPDLSLIFEHGHALHWCLQNRILPAAEVLYGKWLCAGCGTVMGGWPELKEDADTTSKEYLDTFMESQILRPDRCFKCGTYLDADNCLYAEQMFRNFEYKVCGHPDGFLVVPGMEGMGVLEAKSINPKGAWEVRSNPKLDHVVQAQCYMWMTGLRWAKILYWDKAGQGMGALIEHTVEYDPDIIDSVQKTVLSIQEGIEQKMLPDRICETRTCDRAKACASVDLCFES